MRPDSDREAVGKRYAALATAAARGGTCCTPAERTVFGASRYHTDDLVAVPDLAVAASTGCGNPTAVAISPKVRRCSTLAPEAGSTSSSPPAASAPLGRSTAST